MENKIPTPTELLDRLYLENEEAQRIEALLVKLINESKSLPIRFKFTTDNSRAVHIVATRLSQRGYHMQNCRQEIAGKKVYSLTLYISEWDYDT